MGNEDILFFEKKKNLSVLRFVTLPWEIPYKMKLLTLGRGCCRNRGQHPADAKKDTFSLQKN